jgi:hypothetical protein
MNKLLMVDVIFEVALKPGTEHDQGLYRHSIHGKQGRVGWGPSPPSWVPNDRANGPFHVSVQGIVAVDQR